MTALPVSATRASTQATPEASPVATARTVAIGRLFLIETRKLVDTRASRWLLVATFTVAALVVGLSAAFVPQATKAESLLASDLVNIGVGSLTLLLPVMAIMLAAGEWTQHGALVTFTLEPRRVRVLSAKLGAVIAVSLALCAAVMLLSFAVAAGMAGIAHTNVTWTIDARYLAWGVVATVLAGLQGFAFGALLMNTPAAIALYFLYPTALQIIATISSSALEATSWLNVGGAFAPLTGPGLGDVHWGKVAVSVGVWVLLPLIAGAIRLVRREVN